MLASGKGKTKHKKTNKQTNHKTVPLSEMPLSNNLRGIRFTNGTRFFPRLFFCSDCPVKRSQQGPKTWRSPPLYVARHPVKKDWKLMPESIALRGSRGPYSFSSSVRAHARWVAVPSSGLPICLLETCLLPVGGEEFIDVKQYIRPVPSELSVLGCLVESGSLQLPATKF